MTVDREELAELAERFGWKDEAEREAALRETAERARRNKSDEVLAWATARNAAEAEAETPAKERTMKQRPAAMTEDWVRFIRRELNARERSMTGAVADVLGGIEKKHRAALDALSAQVAILRNEISQLRTEVRMRGSLDDMAARLDKIERTARTPLKAIIG